MDPQLWEKDWLMGLAGRGDVFSDGSAVLWLFLLEGGAVGLAGLSETSSPVMRSAISTTRQLAITRGIRLFI